MKKKTTVPDRNLRLEMVPIRQLKAIPGHARKPSRNHRRLIAKSIETIGWVNPIIVDDEFNVIAGKGRWEAAELLGMIEVPVTRVTGMTDADKRAYRLAENRLAEIGGWDDALLADEFQLLIDEDYDLDITGFDMGDIDAIFGGIDRNSQDAVRLPSPEQPVVSRVGDLWNVGDHFLLCGDSRDPQAYGKLLQGQRAQMCFTDPPYNVPINGNVAGIRGKSNHREFALAAGEMTEPQFTEFLSTSIRRISEVCEPGAIVYISMDWKHTDQLLAAAKANGAELKNIAVWAKTNAGLGSFYKSQHEFIVILKVRGGEHINNFQLGQKGRNRTNLWSYAGANCFRKGRSEDLAVHPTMKPVTMVADAILDCSRRKGIILDGFAGSGTTLVAAQRTGRRGYGIEIDPAYVDVVLARLEQETGAEAILESGETFAEVAAHRLQKEAA